MTLLPEYRAQLHTAALRRARRRPVARVARSWPVAVSTLVAVGVVVAADRGAEPPPRSERSRSLRSGPVGPLGRAASPVCSVFSAAPDRGRSQTWVPGFFATFASSGCRAANTPFQCTFRSTGR